MKTIQLTETQQWHNLKRHYAKIRKLHLRYLFEDQDRFNKFSVHDDKIGLVFDYSKNIITLESKELLVDLIRSIKLNDYIDKMFTGNNINFTENRAVLHVALRNKSNCPIYVQGKDIMPDINLMLYKMKWCSDAIRNGSWRGITGKKITDIVNIGIGGSDLGPRMICEALQSYSKQGLNIHFVSNIDTSDIYTQYSKLNLESTIFIISSKTFTTAETLVNARIAKQLIVSKFGYNALKQHFIAISTNNVKALEFGVDKNNIFKFWDFVCGRYSVWSSIGLPIACYIGFNNFVELLNGAYHIDQHFRYTKYENNIPVIMAILSFWYNNFFNAYSHAILPYSQYLHIFPKYIQQLEMESNGKSINMESHAINYHTGSIIWGDVGTNAQHSFFQLLHQGTRLIPCDFIGFIKPFQQFNKNHHKLLMANYFAQTKALAFGVTKQEIIEKLVNDKNNLQDIDIISAHKVCVGNKPTTSILFRELNPKILGALIALYEHKTFVQGVIWNINSFDQWGVELGKSVATEIMLVLNDNRFNMNKITKYDVSTRNLINIFTSQYNIATNAKLR
ncbi:MAG: glucose-6-phosphate isomerase [Endomicrobium sp.]|jgi:glucose-6-phosphate isomerase|nr:glucose-6-phosphate isomerase [Endomicrobium sp.]